MATEQALPALPSPISLPDHQLHQLEAAGYERLADQHERAWQAIESQVCELLPPALRPYVRGERMLHTSRAELQPLLIIDIPEHAPIWIMLDTQRLVLKEWRTFVGLRPRGRFAIGDAWQAAQHYTDDPATALAYARETYAAEAPEPLGGSSGRAAALLRARAALARAASGYHYLTHRGEFDSCGANLCASARTSLDELDALLGEQACDAKLRA